MTANEIIERPDKYLLSTNDLYKAEGGATGLALQMTVLMLGVGSVFAGNPKFTQLFRVGGFTWREWATVGGVGLASNYVGTTASVYMMGNATAYHRHWMAYYYVKSCNRWEGRQILKKAPMMY